MYTYIQVKQTIHSCCSIKSVSVHKAVVDIYELPSPLPHSMLSLPLARSQLIRVLYLVK